MWSPAPSPTSSLVCPPPRAAAPDSASGVVDQNATRIETDRPPQRTLATAGGEAAIGRGTTTVPPSGGCGGGASSAFGCVQICSSPIATPLEKLVAADVPWSKPCHRTTLDAPVTTTFSTCTSHDRASPSPPAAGAPPAAAAPA